MHNQSQTRLLSRLFRKRPLRSLRPGNSLLDLPSSYFCYERCVQSVRAYGVQLSSSKQWYWIRAARRLTPLALLANCFPQIPLAPMESGCQD